MGSSCSFASSSTQSSSRVAAPPEGSFMFPGCTSLERSDSESSLQSNELYPVSKKTENDRVRVNLESCSSSSCTSAPKIIELKGSPRLERKAPIENDLKRRPSTTNQEEDGEISMQRKKILKSSSSLTSLSSIDTEGFPLSFLVGSDSFDKGLERVGVFYRLGSLIAFCMWLILLAIVCKVAPADSWDEPSGGEQSVHVVTMLLLFVTNGSKFIPLILRENNLEFCKSGLMVGTLTVQCIAISSNFLMAYFPTPVMFDEISGQRVHLFRWCEWVPLAFLMTFLTCNVDSSLRKHEKAASHFKKPILLALSTLAGLLFPFCKTIDVWLVVLTLSWVLFSAIYVLLYERYKRYYEAKSKLEKKKYSRQSSSSSLPSGKAVDTTQDYCIEESFDVIRTSYSLSIVCSFTWTFLSLAFTFISMAPTFGEKYAPGLTFLRSPGLPSLVTGSFEVASKIWYLQTLIDAYDRIFDKKSRAIRRLEQLRSFMSAVWDSSSDVIVFAGEDPETGRVSARISPAFFDMVGMSTGKMPYLDRGDVSLVLEIFPDKEVFYVFAIDLSTPVTRKDAERFKNSLTAYDLVTSSSGDNPISIQKLEGMTLIQKNLTILANLAMKACRIQSESDNRETYLTQEIASQEINGDEALKFCEAKITKLNSDQSCVIVMRDISDRVQRFETEKWLVKEMTIRKKDAEANRFARHEVKNGILAAIGLLEHMREYVTTDAASETAEASASECGTIVSSSEKDLSATTTQPGCHPNISSSAVKNNYIDCSLKELDNTLHDILDTVLDEAMAREIIYGEYQPKKERMKVPEVLGSLRRQSSNRFPLKVEPASPFPQLSIDRHLLRYIYRNAMSNACKYGKEGGKVETLLKYDDKKERFRMEVINEPGEGHEDLMRMCHSEVATIFHPGIQLNAKRVAAGNQAQIIRNESSGNGAWIQQKCAEALKGKCDIRFEEEKTVFCFECPVKAYYPDSNLKPTKVTFQIPDGTWAVAIDDSAIQRKLMNRFLGMAGIVEERRLLLGKDAQEVYSFCDTVKKILEENPNDKVIVIADENLDIEDGGACHETVSGSLSVQKLRKMLDQSTEKRLLALIRSANDSMRDVEMYMSRAHGYLLKEPIKKGRILEVIEPWWTARFDSVKQDLTCGESGNESFDCLYSPTKEEILGSLNVIQVLLASTQENALVFRWKTIREKMHILKGDLKTIASKKPLTGVFQKIDEFLVVQDPPQNFAPCWAQLQGDLESLL